MGNNKVVIGATLTADGSQANKTVQSFKAELKKAAEELLHMQGEFGEFSNEAIVAAKRVAELRDNIDDARSLTDAFNPDAKFRALGQSIQGVVGGVTAYQGALGLVGIQSQEVEQALLKVQSAMAFSQGIDSVLESIQGFKNLNVIIQQSTVFQKVNNAATAAATAMQRLFGASVIGTGTAFNILKGAIIATGIGALLVGVGFLVSKISSWIDKTDEAKEAQDRLNGALERQEELLQEELDGIDYGIKARVLRAKIAGKTEAEIRAIEKNGGEQHIDALKRNMQAADRVEDEANRNSKLKAEEKKKIQEKAGKARQDYYKELGKQDTDALQFDLDVANKKREKEKEDLEKSKAKLEEQKKQNDQQIEEARRLNAELAKENQVNGGGSEQDREIIKLNQEFDAKRAILIKGGQSTIELEAAYQAKRLEIFEKYNKERQDKFDDATKEENKKNFDRISEQIEQERVASELKTANKQKEVDGIIQAAAGVVAAEGMSYNERLAIINMGEANLLANKELTEEQRTTIEQAFSNARKEIARNEMEAKREMMNLEAGLLDASAELAGKSTAAGKALAVAATLISTYTSAQKAYESQFLPVPDPTSPVRGAIAAATAVIGGLAKVKAIISVPVPGQSGGGSIAGGVSAPLQPTLSNSTTQLNPNQVAQINNQGNQAIKAYVVTTDINNDQEKITRINRAARIG